jgi:hypothetical protein
MMLLHSMRPVSLASAVILLSWAPVANASEWNERTTLKFSEPVMVPGATLPAGSYIFKLADTTSNRHIVQILSEDGVKAFATTLAVPMKRQDPNPDVVLKFDPTEPGAPPAIRAWFYPGSLYGHEFVYPEKQASNIAERTKTLVLSTDVAGTDLERGTLYVYDASGKRGVWRADAEAMRQWDAWRRSRQSETPTGTSGRIGGEISTVPMIQDDPKGMRITVDELEDNAAKYTGKTVTVDAEVEEVFGPRLFSIDEPRWADLDGELFVLMPSQQAALVRENDRVTVTGTIKPFALTALQAEWGWLETDPDVETELAARPVFHATRIVGGDSDVAMLIDIGKPGTSGTTGAKQAGQSAVGTTGSSRTGSSHVPLTDVASIAAAPDTDLVGRKVDLTKARVAKTAKDGGFWIRGAADRSVFVLPTDPKKLTVGDTVNIDGVVLQMPRGMRDRLQAPANANQTIYIYSTNVDKP